MVLKCVSCFVAWHYLCRQFFVFLIYIIFLVKFCLSQNEGNAQLQLTSHSETRLKIAGLGTRLSHYGAFYKKSALVDIRGKCRDESAGL